MKVRTLYSSLDATMLVPMLCCLWALATMADMENRSCHAMKEKKNEDRHSETFFFRFRFQQVDRIAILQGLNFLPLPDHMIDMWNMA
jgi:hypothetical protein